MKWFKKFSLLKWVKTIETNKTIPEPMVIPADSVLLEGKPQKYLLIGRVLRTNGFNSYVFQNTQDKSIVVDNDKFQNLGKMSEEIIRKGTSEYIPM